MRCEAGLLSDHGTTGCEVAGGAVAEPSCIEPHILILGTGVLALGVPYIITIAIPIDAQVVRENESPIVPLKEFELLLLLDIGGHLERFARTPGRLDKTKELQ